MGKLGTPLPPKPQPRSDALDMAHNAAVHFGLGVSLATIARRKQARGELS